MKQSRRAAHRRCTCDGRFRARCNLRRVWPPLHLGLPVRDRESVSDTTCDAVLSNATTPKRLTARLPCDSRAFHVPTSEWSGRVETARRYRGMRRSPMSRDRGPASWSRYYFLIDVLDTLR